MFHSSNTARSSARTASSRNRECRWQFLAVMPRLIAIGLATPFCVYSRPHAQNHTHRTDSAGRAPGCHSMSLQTILRAFHSSTCAPTTGGDCARRQVFTAQPTSSNPMIAHSTSCSCLVRCLMRENVMELTGHRNAVKSGKIHATPVPVPRPKSRRETKSLTGAPPPRSLLSDMASLQTQTPAAQPSARRRSKFKHP